MAEVAEQAIETIISSDDKAALSHAELSQPLCTAVQIAIVDLLASWGITPTIVVGHSSGEIAAAYAAGALTRESALIVAYYRGFVCKNFNKAGGMAAVGMGTADVQQFLVPGVGIACENSNSSVTLSGDLTALDLALEKIKAHNGATFARRLQVTTAYHSGMLARSC